jgi:hypothetical protein
MDEQNLFVLQQAKEEISGYLDGIAAWDWWRDETDDHDESDTQEPGYNGQQKCEESKRVSILYYTKLWNFIAQSIYCISIV